MHPIGSQTPIILHQEYDYMLHSKILAFNKNHNPILEIIPPSIYHRYDQETQEPFNITSTPGCYEIRKYFDSDDFKTDNEGNLNLFLQDSDGNSHDLDFKLDKKRKIPIKNSYSSYQF